MKKSQIALTNLGLYNEGTLLYKWLEVPCTNEEFKQALTNIKVANNTEYEEFFISDWENIEGIGEYSSIKEVNRIATMQRLINDKIEESNNNHCVSTDEISKAINQVLSETLPTSHDIDDIENILEDMTIYLSENYIDSRGFQETWKATNEYFNNYLLDTDEKLRDLTESDFYMYFDEKAYIENDLKHNDIVKYWDNDIIIMIND